MNELDLELSLAWKRLKLDVKDRAFVRYPDELRLAGLRIHEYLGSVAEMVKDGTYTPRALDVLDAPKAGGLVRPGADLALTDRLVYLGLVTAAFPKIHAALMWSQDVVDFAYRFQRSAQRRDWLRNQYEGWKRWRTKSLDALDAGATHVVFADIAGFYEHIDLALLASELRRVGVDDEVVSSLSRSLNRWAQIRGRGLPQGTNASDVLAKLYISSLDEALLKEGFFHFRYVDDLRIFCGSRVEAQRAMIRLAQLLRQKGLSLQSAKSQILEEPAAREKILGIEPVIRDVAQRFVEFVIGKFGIPADYIPVFDADQILSSELDEVPVVVVREAYANRLLDPELFDPSLFRFILNRLAAAHDKLAVRDSVSFLRSYPEEATAVLDYLTAVGAYDEVVDAVVAFLRSDAGALYAYQTYQILTWLFVSAPAGDERAASAGRQYGFETGMPKYVRVIARRLLGRTGGPADLERLLSTYADVSDPVEQWELICSIRELERLRRNEFLGRAATDGFFQSVAAEAIRGGRDLDPRPGESIRGPGA